MSAQAGAPGTIVDSALNPSILVLRPAERFKAAPYLSPAEIRNGVSVRMDQMAAQGIPVDRASVDGIGLEISPVRSAETNPR